MKIAIFDEYSQQGQYFIDEQGMVWLHGTLLSKRLGFANPSEAITKHTDEDERRKEELDGRLVWYVSEPGIWGMIIAAKTPEAKAFKRKLKHDILPKLRADGFYIARRDGETISKLQAEIEDIKWELEGEKQERQYLEEVNGTLKDSNSMLLDSDKLKMKVWDYCRKHLKYKKRAYTECYVVCDAFNKKFKLDIESKLFAVYASEYFQTLGKNLKLRMHIEKANYWNDFENCVFIEKPKYHPVNSNIDKDKYTIGE